jgi:DNA-binding CsgD family transcriptional regulator
VLISDYLKLAPAERTRQGQLTPRGLEIVQLIAAGHTARQIAERLVISEKTVDRHRTNILENCTSRTAWTSPATPSAAASWMHDSQPPAQAPSPGGWATGRGQTRGGDATLDACGFVCRGAHMTPDLMPSR